MMIELNSIDERKDYPFISSLKTDLDRLVLSIERNGLIEMPVVRETEDGRMEFVTGYKRKRACETLGMRKIPCTVIDCDDDMAKKLMIELHLIDRHIFRKK